MPPHCQATVYMTTGVLTGRVSMTCVALASQAKRNAIVASMLTAFAVLAALACGIVMRWQRILAELTQLRMNRVKRG